MRHESYTQYAIVQGDSAETLTNKLNEKMIELNSKHPQVSFEGLVARISYTETVAIPESLSDQWEMDGCSFGCSDCPCFEPILNKDGSENRVVKYGNCKYSQYGRTYKTTQACDVLFKLINSGEVKLCFAESDS